VRIVEQIDVGAPPESVWALISDPARTMEFMAGLTRWEVDGDRPRGLGARYRILTQVGSAELGGLVEVVEYIEARDLAWRSVTGLDMRGRWRVRHRPHGRSRVQLRVAYGIAGAGVGGWIAERVAAPMARRHLKASLAQLKRIVEQEQIRQVAAQRRARRQLV
jgi:uncharacterized membrane protein